MEILSQSRILLCLLAGLLFMTSVAAHGRYRAYIPNGYIIPNPCPAADGGEAIWNGVGHLNVEGRGALNPFGQDFADNGKVYNNELCSTDSDGDGRSNGEEMGDPECVWQPGQTPSTAPIGHPGVCEPVDTAACIQENAAFDIDWTSC